MPLALLSIGPFELVLLAAAAVLLFGGDLPDVARKAAGWVARIRQVSADLTRELNQHVPAPPDLRPPSSLTTPPELHLGEEQRSFKRPVNRPPTEGVVDVEPAPTTTDEAQAPDSGEASPADTAGGLGRREDVPPAGWVRPEDHDAAPAHDPDLTPADETASGGQDNPSGGKRAPGTDDVN